MIDISMLEVVTRMIEISYDFCSYDFPVNVHDKFVIRNIVCNIYTACTNKFRSPWKYMHGRVSYEYVHTVIISQKNQFIKLAIYYV